MEKYFEDPDSLTADEIIAAIRKATIGMEITPLLCGSAFKNKGVQTMLDAVMMYLPSPYDVEAIVGTAVDDEEVKIERKPDPDEPFAGLAFKIATDPFVGRLCFVRAYSGKLPAGSYVITHAAARRSVFRASSKCTRTSRTPSIASKQGTSAQLLALRTSAPVTRFVLKAHHWCWRACRSQIP